MKVAVYDSKIYDKEYLMIPKESIGIEYSFFDFKLNINTVNTAKGFDAVCVFVNDVLDREVLSELQTFGIHKIALRCSGYNQVDLKTAEKLGIAVYRVPAYSPMAVAEHAVALLLNLSRKIHKAYNRVREGNFSLDGLVGFDIYKKKVGVVGTGNIGKAFANILLGFGAEIFACDIQENQELIQKGIQYTNLENLIQEVDILSLHVPLLDSTYHLISRERLWKMKKGSILINTSRGALVDSKGLVEVLKKGHLGGAGLDVYEEEQNYFFSDWSNQVISDDTLARLLTFPNVILTAHQGFLTKEALMEIARITAMNLKSNPIQPGLQN